MQKKKKKKNLNKAVELKRRGDDNQIKCDDTMCINDAVAKTTDDDDDDIDGGAFNFNFNSMRQSELKSMLYRVCACAV